MTDRTFRHVATIYPTPAQLQTQPGPITATRYAYVSSLGALFEWQFGTVKTPDNFTTIGHSGGGAGTWVRVRSQDKQAYLADANATITASDGGWRIMQAGTLTTGRAVTLSDADAEGGDQITITRLDVSANTLTIKNGGAGGGDIAVMGGSKVSFLRCEFDGTDWQVRELGAL